MKFVLIALALAAPQMAHALPEGVARAALRPGWQAADGGHIAALELVLSPEWKTYWRAPGSGGIPPVFDWAGSENLGDLRLIWPRPMVFDAGGVTSVGYHDAMILPFKVIAADPSRPVVLNGSVTLGVCKDICIPVTLSLHAALPQTDRPDPVITAALADVPQVEQIAARCAVQPISDGLRVTAEVDLPGASEGDHIVIEHRDGSIWISDAEMAHWDGGLGAALDMVPKAAKPFDLNGDDIVITVLGAARAIEIHGCAISAASP